MDIRCATRSIPREENRISKCREAKGCDKGSRDSGTTIARSGSGPYLDSSRLAWEGWQGLREENQQIWRITENFLASGRVKASAVSDFTPNLSWPSRLREARWSTRSAGSIVYLISTSRHDIVVEAYSPTNPHRSHQGLSIAAATACALQLYIRATCCGRGFVDANDQDPVRAS